MTFRFELLGPQSGHHSAYPHAGVHFASYRSSLTTCQRYDYLCVQIVHLHS